MRSSGRCVAACLLMLTASAAPGQVVLRGQVLAPHPSGAAERIPLTNILCVAGLNGPGSQALITRTLWDHHPWDTEPVGGYRVTGAEGTYTLAFTNPSHFMRPVLLTNQFALTGETRQQNAVPVFSHACFDESESDPEPATVYWQTFVANVTNVTHVGFKLARNVSADADGSRNLLVSIHRKAEGAPDTWAQIGPAATVLYTEILLDLVKAAGARSFPWSAGWDSGEVPTTLGEEYAVRIATESPSRTFQVRWGSDGDSRTKCYRKGPAGHAGPQDHDLWLAVAGDGDGLVIPYNKRVHKEFAARGRFASKWSQTYVARGRSLASVVLYGSGSTEQISINRQRLAVRVRDGGPDGRIVGIKKVASGNGDYTGDASWGIFAAAYAPGEVPLEPGHTYAIEFETFESFNTLHGYINIKNVPSGDTGGFTPFIKAPRDDYAKGTAWINGKEAVNFDLDMQAVEYEHAAADWADAVDGDNLLVNGDMQLGTFEPEHPEQGRPEAWQSFAIDPGTTHHYVVDEEHPSNRMLRVIGGCWNGKTVDGGYVQRVEGLEPAEAYRLSGRVRSSWAVDEKHQCFIGFDPTGQDRDPSAKTICWTTLPSVHGVFVPHTSEPIWPNERAISVWLRARTTSTAGTPISLKLDPMIFRVEFDVFALRRVNTGVPTEK